MTTCKLNSVDFADAGMVICPFDAVSKMGCLGVWLVV
jgi:hypothetical protein